MKAIKEFFRELGHAREELDLLRFFKDLAQARERIEQIKMDGHYPPLRR